MWKPTKITNPRYPEVVKAIWEDGSEAEAIFYPLLDEWFEFVRGTDGAPNHIAENPFDFSPMFWKRMGT